MNLTTACKSLTKDHLFLSKECDDSKKDITGDQGYVTTDDKKRCATGGENDKRELLTAEDRKGDSEGNDIGKEDPQDSEFDIMLEPSEMKKIHMILANLKNSVPINSRCVIINNNFVRKSDNSTNEPSPDDDNVYLPTDEKLDIIIYVTDVIYHEVDSLQKECDAKFELLNKKMAVIDKKLDILLDNVKAAIDQDDGKSA